MKILYLMSTFNLFGGTPKKTLDLIHHSCNECSLYVWGNGHEENRIKFTDAGAKVFHGGHGRNIFRHIKAIIDIVDEQQIDVVQTQFTYGEILAGLVKIFRPNIKVVTAFVVPFTPKGFRKILIKYFYTKVDHLVYVSKYVKSEKEKVLPILKQIDSSVIHNGTLRREDSGDECIDMKSIALFDTAGLTEWKNIRVLVDAVYVLVNEYGQKNVFLYVAGDGPDRAYLESKIKELNLTNNIFLLGYQKNIGRLLKSCNIFVHPAYAEGFGVAIAEAMMEGKAIVVSDAGALPELIENEKSGLVISPFDARAWADAIMRLVNNPELACKLGINAQKIANERFSVDVYAKNYDAVYQSLAVDTK